MDDHVHLTRRERQIMDVLYERGEASVGEVRRALPNAPSYSAVRALMRKLLDKGHASYREEGTRYVYRPVLARNRARRSALQRVVNTFFDGSAADAVVGLLGNERNLTDEELARIQASLEKLKAPRS
ncbi:MAG: BlaI/MecI/CopY family transcriptional regulator [Gammaproteobacteria bacterium]|nr:BlaI/MecI/CopY family transcriptional regulator [Gammaproteobacteria bacterium]MXY57485.1 BlaI/MecI/CopY family transcriptional regulator [Gammaproteobacteria bacterium]MYF28738.1 BlaI/MecI/CopY family transcriptional regulator [Gammaproteobacteria bacterium]MYK45742.1 BlaI/MecI/CopY family transcriptional regulator [Gammaproteobacteria bacterium]MYK47684.1 BlaI/MecI/CopY family transcriptional regulator [Gammaproteobacteria bacterium]